MAYIFRFDLHHIFSKSVFEAFLDPYDESKGNIGDALTELYQGQDLGILKDMSANKIGLFWSPGSVHNLASLLDDGFGLSPHGSIGSHAVYSDFLANELKEILSNSSLEAADKRAAVFDAHYFATEVSRGTLVDANGQQVHLGSDLTAL